MKIPRFFTYFIFLSLFSLILAFGQAALVFAQGANPPAVNLVLNGIQLPQADVPAQIINDRTFVPIRHVLEAMGALVDFDDDNRLILVDYEGGRLIMQIGQYHFYFNNTRYYMDVAPIIINDRTLLPISFVAVALGYDVRWDGQSFTVYIDKQDANDLDEYEANYTEVVEDEIYFEIPEVLDVYSIVDYLDDAQYTAAMDDDDNDASLASLSTDLSYAPIVAQNHPIAHMYDITYNQLQTQFIIHAQTPISNATWYMLPDGRLVVDVINARADFGKSRIDIDNGHIAALRMGQNVINNVDVARVVFDLDAPARYFITLSYDRMALIVDFESNKIGDISFLSNYDYNATEAIIITADVMPATNVFFLQEPLRLVIDMPNARLQAWEYGYFQDNEEALIAEIDSQFIYAIRYSQFNEATVRIVVELYDSVSFSVQAHGNTATITLAHRPYRNISFNRASGALEIALPEGVGLRHILRFEQYLDKQYILTLPGDFSSHFGYGRFMVNYGGIDFVDIVTINDMTTFIINANGIFAYIIEEDEGNITIRTAALSEVHDFIVLIDPGHGGHDPGAVHRGMRESDLTLEVAMMVKEMLADQPQVRVFLTRHTDSTVPLTQRSSMANDIADIFVSIHFNASPQGTARGTETLYAISAAEVGAAFNSRHLADIMQSHKVTALGSVDRGLRYRPAIHVLRATDMPAVLLEIGFMDHPQESLRIADPGYRRIAARAIADGILDAARVYSPNRD